MTTSSTSAPLLGTVLADRYEVVRHIARGGMGDVYEAQDRLLRRQVAVKVFRASAPADRSRFDAEVHTLAALNHPGLVQVYDAGEHHGDGYVVLELVDGPTLRSIVAERGALPSTEVARLGAAVADALAYVHRAGVVHRDVTPANVLCGPDDRPRLADFGIARLLDTTRVTLAATAIGTAAYMAPEQVEGSDVTPAADVYALGLVLREALTGRAAFTGAAHEVAIARLVHDPDVESDVPAPWHPLLREMTAREPGDRPSASDVSDRLAVVARGAGAVASPPMAPGAAAAGAMVVGDGDVDSDAATQMVEAGGGTTVMPAVLRPAELASAGPGSAARSQGKGGSSRRALWAALAALVLVVVAGLASRGGGGFQVPPTTTVPVVVTVPVTTTTTAPPPTTTAPPKDHGKGKNDD